jgi:nitrous oxide reductase
MNRRQVLRAAVLLPTTLAAACGRREAGPAPIATISVSSPGQAQSTETSGAAKTQAKPTFIEFYAEW